MCLNVSECVDADSLFIHIHNMKDVLLTGAADDYFHLKRVQAVVLLVVSAMRSSAALSLCYRSFSDIVHSVWMFFTERTRTIRQTKRKETQKHSSLTSR